jgi:protein-S-isoprenylcysteine O-methyltransferase Ste14
VSETQPKAGWLPWPPLIYLTAIVVAIALSALFPLPWLTGLLADLLFVIGWLVLLAVVALWFTAFRAMHKANTTLNPNGVPTHLITTGPFSVSRNPIYLANSLLLIGVGLAGGMAWFVLLAFAASLATSMLAIRREEKVLAAKFGKKYRDYAKGVRRWI